jgi:hypothetical protein
LFILGRARFSANRIGRCSSILNSKELLMNRYFLFAFALLIAFASCQKTKTQSAATPKEIDPCSLITKDEVQKIQGSPVKEVKPSTNSDGSFRISQCFYTTETFNESVSLALTERDPASDKARDPKAFWKDTFGRYASRLKEEEGDEEKRKSLGDQDEERGAPPKKIEGVGDDAWWTANRMGGAIYVLKNNAFIRISVGGTGNQDSKIEKSKALAAKALSRL